MNSRSLISGFCLCLSAFPAAAAELTHRWSFNGDYSDSAGGADAVKCGTYVSLSGGCDSAVFEIVDGRGNEQR